jgi:peptide-methionine (R)-S-oxide reductase
MASSNSKQEQQTPAVNLSDAEWKAKLTPEQYRVLREKGTESPYKGEYNEHKETGIYKCAGCGQALYE